MVEEENPSEAELKKQMDDDWKQIALRGRSTEQFILDQKAEIQAQYSEQGGEAPGIGDIVVMLLTYQNMGVITQNDVAKAVPQLGKQFGIEDMTPEKYFGDIVPQVQQELAAYEEQERLEQEKKAREEASEYAKAWGMERLDGIAQYYQQHARALQGVENANWDDRFRQYTEGREARIAALSATEDPFQQQRLLQQTLFFLTGLHPREAEMIYRTEKNIGSYVYMDSLFDLSRNMLYKTALGRSPDEMDGYYRAGGVGVAVRFYSIDNPASVMAAQREDAFQNLWFGASRPLEEHTVGKPLIRPYQRYSMGH